MREMISVPLDRQVFEKLQKLATPLVDDANTVIGRLIDHWEATGYLRKVVQVTELWRSSRGEKFLVGTRLRANYQGREYFATVTAAGIEYNKKVFDNPSAAGVEVKRGTGTRGKAAQTNGWDFWEMYDAAGERWVSINTLRRRS